VPDFHLDDVLIAVEINDQVGPSHSSSPGFNVVIAGAVKQRADIQKEELSAVVLDELIRAAREAFCKVLYEFLQHQLHIKRIPV